MTAEQQGHTPDIIEVLGFTLSALEYWFKKSNPEWDGSAEEGSTIGDARAAIAKATGAQS
jgi:hypothetical protein